MMVSPIALKHFSVFPLAMLFVANSVACWAQTPANEYLRDIRLALKKEWPENRTINLVFHGHSVPAGYFRTPDVRTLEAYPYQVLKGLKEMYPAAVINVIVTAIGGENSEQGARRFAKDVLTHRPDVIFIDYGLNDRRIGLARAEDATKAMVRKALKKKIRVILLTPSPDLRVNITEPDNELERFSSQIKRLAKDHGTGLVDSYEAFRLLVLEGQELNAYMSQSNHPNAAGHALIAAGVLQFFR